MDSAAKLLGNYADDDAATTAIEYSLIAAGLSIAIASVIPLIGGRVQGMFEQLVAML